MTRLRHQKHPLKLEFQAGKLEEPGQPSSSKSNTAAHFLHMGENNALCRLLAIWPAFLVSCTNYRIVRCSNHNDVSISLSQLINGMLST